MWPVPLVPLPGAPGEWVEVMSEQRKSGGLCRAMPECVRVDGRHAMGMQSRAVVLSLSPELKLEPSLVSGWLKTSLP